MPTTQKYLRSDATLLVLVGAEILLKGILYAWPGDATLAMHAHPAEHALPLQTWAYVWIIAGAVCLLAAIREQRMFQAFATGLAVAINATWGCSLLIGAITGDPRGWSYSISYITIACLSVWAIWRGKRGDVDICPREKGRKCCSVKC